MTLDAGHRTGLLSKTDACIPTESAVVHWLDFSGFKYIFVEKHKFFHRKRFIACKDKEWSSKYESHPDLIKIDSTYWHHMAELSKIHYTGGRP